MTHEDAQGTFRLAALDLAAFAAARESFPRHVTELARRRAPRYAAPSQAPVGDAYWNDLAASIAPLLPSELMPMWGLIDADLTLEGGAKGLRSLFSATPSARERRKVQRTATLAARVMSVVAHADGAVAADERRLIDMAMASFGLNDEELAAARAEGPTSASQLEVFGELDLRVRREVVRGAWQLALHGDLSKDEESAVVTIAAKLEISAELDLVRREVRDAQERCARVASLALELAMAASSSLDGELRAPALEHLIRCAAPPSVAAGLRARASGETEPPVAQKVALVSAQRVQALTLAWASLRSLDLPASTEALVRLGLRAAAARHDASADANSAMELVDRYLLERLAESSERG